MNQPKALPKDFGRALFQNKEAVQFFERCTAKQKQVIVAQACVIETQNEMQAFVAHLPSATL